ncbi:putative inorganic carbon transporter subunit DabA [Enhygromyxa salina]|uniref:putative inorganic carbon transporter subunit DabA n=1 Tax=Enhygromyxa salina TaxID=215803 RepID=UPI0015E7050C|nr:putative inorganic carbon transporter subunit DabA [Enhygromyxa salina]
MSDPGPAPSIAPAQPPADARDRLHHALEHAAHLLPDQAPLEMFVHHNTLHALAHLPFHHALRIAHGVYDAQVYRSEQEFRSDLACGRIDPEELDRELDRYLHQRGLDPTQDMGGLCTRRALYAVALRVDLAPPTRAALRWRVREEQFDRRLAARADTNRMIEAGRDYLRELVTRATTAELTQRFLGPNGVPSRMGERYAIPLEIGALLRQLETDPEPLVAGSMWQTCRVLARECEVHASAEAPARTWTHRDELLNRTGRDIWEQTLPELLGWAAAYLEEGLAYWPMPGREAGFFGAVRELLLARGHVRPWIRRAVERLEQLREATATDAILTALAALGVAPEQYDQYLLELLAVTPGFAGMFSRLERHPHERATLAPPTSLTEFCAVRLVFEWAAVELAATEHGLGAIDTLVRTAATRRDAPHPDTHAAYRLFILAQVLGLAPAQLDTLTPSAANELLDALDTFDELDRCRVFLEAYELRYRTQILDGMRSNRPAKPGLRAARPSAQFVTCIDDREESFRRHIEEVDPSVETFGAAGSFGLAIAYRGLDAAGHIPLAPAGVRPRHEIFEHPLTQDAAIGERRRSRRRRWGAFLHQLFFGSRSAVRGALTSLAIGPLAWLPLGVRIMAPRASVRALAWVGARVLPKPRTRLTNDEACGPSPRGLASGYGFAEQVDRVHALLEGIGLRESVAPLVFLLAHGSTSVNNPHAAAYDCGACGGRRGGATGRLLVSFANDPAVRVAIAARGIQIPSDTWFVAGEHDTTADRIELFDLDLLPASHAGQLERARAVMEEARTRNGHERSRKFEHAALTSSAQVGLRHVEARASHFGETRPEYNHCTNAMCVVSRRSLTRGLFLDRRAFLVSYDPDSDRTGAVLDRLLAIAAPVGAGINLEYYFSRVDPERFGCGTKLPHNVCGYIGVLNGTSGDLRTGLSTQMTEIHEPMRLLVIVEATPQALLAAAAREPIVAELITKGWIRLVSVDPDTGEMQLFEAGAFVACDTHEPAPLATATTSGAYYAGRREPLPPARVLAALGGQS